MLTLVCALAACNDSSSDQTSDSPLQGLPLPTTSPIPDGGNLGALTTGTFHAARTPQGACAWIGEKRAAFVWPYGYRVSFDPVELLDPDGQVVAREGDIVTVGGGFGTVRDKMACASVGEEDAWFANPTGRVGVVKRRSGPSSAASSG